MNNTTRHGIIFAIIAAIISGFSIFYNKLVVVKGVDPLIFNILKNGGVGIILTVLLITSRKITKLKALSRKQWISLLLIAVVGGSIPFLLFFEGLKSIPAINASIIQKSLFLWVALLALPLLKEKLSKLQLVGFALIAWSNLFLGGFSGFTFGKGEQLILMATLLWTIENILAKITLKHLDSTIVTWGRMFGGSIILLSIATLENKATLLSSVTASQLIQTTGSILFLTLYVISWYKAVKMAPVTLVASILILATPITNILTSIFISHSISQIQSIQGATTILGVILIAVLARKPNDQERTAPIL